MLGRTRTCVECLWAILVFLERIERGPRSDFADPWEGEVVGLADDIVVGVVVDVVAFAFAVGGSH